MEIRQAVSSDFETVKYITRTTILTVYPHYYPAGAVAFFLAHHSDTAIRKDIADNRVFMLISDSEESVGTVTISGNDIGRLFVLPEQQGSGYGRELLAFAEKTIAMKYAEAVLSASFSARAMYLRHGYKTTDYQVIETENGDFLCYDNMKKCVLSKYHRVIVNSDEYAGERVFRGAIGYIIEIYDDACEVEFSRADGTSYAQIVIKMKALAPLPESAISL